MLYVTFQSINQSINHAVHQCEVSVSVTVLVIMVLHLKCHELR